jgi:hypothetical protein
MEDTDTPTNTAEIVQERFINDILQESAATKHLQEDLPFVFETEKHALTEMATLRPEMSVKLGEARWDICMQKWHLWETHQNDERLGSAVKAVITALDAPHLTPSLINSQLQEGNVAASFSYLTLMTNLSEPSST